MGEQTIWYAENINLESILEADNTMKSAFDQKKIRYKKGEYIYLPDDNSDRIFFVLSGKIKVGTYRDNEKEVINAILQKGDVFGETSIIGQQKRKDFAIASEESILVAVTMQELESYCTENRAMSMLIMRMMGTRTEEMESRLESLVFKDSKTRIIEYLLYSIEKNGQRIGYEWVLRNMITHQDIASLTATSRQTVTMVLNELRNENIIQFDRKRLLVRDLDKLKSLVKQP